MKTSAETRGRLLAVDPSLVATGWALFDLRSEKLGAVGVISSQGTEVPLARRLNKLQADVQVLFEGLNFSSADTLVCEGPAPLVHNPQSALKIEQVRGIFESLARVHGADTPGRINPRSVHTELLGMRGKQQSRKEVKEWARETAMKLCGPQLEALPLNSNDGVRFRKIPQDIIDAVLIGTLALSRIRMARQLGVENAEIFAPRANNKFLQSSSGRRGSSGGRGSSGRRGNAGRGGRSGRALRWPSGTA